MKDNLYLQMWANDVDLGATPIDFDEGGKFQDIADGMYGLYEYIDETVDADYDARQDLIIAIQEAIFPLIDGKAIGEEFTVTVRGVTYTAYLTN